MPARLTCWGSLCRLGAWCVVLTLFAASAALAQDPLEDKGLPLLQARKIPPEMEIDDKELMTDADEAEFRKKGKETAFQNALKSGNLTDDEKKALDEGAKWWAYRLTMKKYREEEAPPKKADKGDKVEKVKAIVPPKERLPDLRRNLLNTIKTYTINAPKPAPGREYFLKVLTERLGELLDNHLVVRLNAVLLLGQLQADYPKNADPIPYSGSYAVLLKVIKDEKQHLGLKVAAVRGLTRICRSPALDANDKRRVEIAMALVPELDKKETFWWYQMALAECLGAAGVLSDPANKQNPVVLQALFEVLRDPKRDWQARTKAAEAIGYLPLEGGVNVAAIMHEMVKLGQQIAQGYNANPKREAWSNHIVTLYFAFKSSSPAAKVAGGKRKPGLLEALPSSREVKDAYEQIVLIAMHVLNSGGKQFSEVQLKALEEWLQKNKPGKPDLAAPAATPPAKLAPSGP